MEHQNPHPNPNNDQIYRNHSDKIIAGVCVGIAEYYRTDVLLVRIAFTIMAFFGGAGIILYILCVFLIPAIPGSANGSVANSSHRRYSLAEDINQHMARNHNGSHAILGLFIIIVGALFLIDNFFPGFGFYRLWPIILILVGLIIAFRNHPNKS